MEGHDVIIMGGGPAGLTLGCYLARAGVPSLILEKAHHPRPHVGESLMPATIRILREIGFIDIMESAGFPHSGGVVYHPGDLEDAVLPYAEFPQAGIDGEYTYHVDRARFDMLLMKHAETLGCHIIEGASAEEVLFDGASAVSGVKVDFGGRSIELEAPLVVDAAGRNTRIGRQLGIRETHPVLDQFALHAWCEGVDRGPSGTESWTHVYFLPEVRGWAWQSPIDEGITSIGVVADKEAYQSAGLVVEDFFDECLALNPKLAHATRGLSRLNEIKGEVNYSYRLDRVCGDGWLAIGDAARFIDPVFSSGVSSAMHSARFAAERIGAAHFSGDYRRSTFLPYEEDVMAGAAIWDDFTRLFYRLLPGFTHLLQSDEHRPALMRMIQGDLTPQADTAVLDAFRSLIRSVEEVDDHPWSRELLELPL